MINDIVSLCKRRGFIFPGSEIYGGLANSWDYGPLGAQMKMNIKKDWWKTFVESRTDMVGLDAAILMNPSVWEASGHVETFNDPLVEDKITNKRYRADHLIEEVIGGNCDGKSLEELAGLISEHNIKSPDGNELTAPRQYSGMFKMKLGSGEEEDKVIYLRPETAQAIFVNFKNVTESMRKKLPFGIGQIGKAFRNEITPGNFIFRTLEFEQMEIEYFVEEAEWETHFNNWLEAMQSWAEKIGIDTSKLSKLEVAKDALAHYSKRTVDLEFDFPFGTKELWGLAYRTDFDLSNHQEHSKQKMTYTDPADNARKIIPHVIEPSMGVDRTLLAMLVSAYNKEELEDGDSRIVMKLKPEMAPYQVAVLPLMKKEGMPEKATEILSDLQKQFRCEYDESGSIGKRYRRHDEIGTPYCITVDFDTVEKGIVTVRDRDSMLQESISIDELKKYLSEKMN